MDFFDKVEYICFFEKKVEYICNKNPVLLMFKEKKILCYFNPKRLSRDEIDDVI